MTISETSTGLDAATQKAKRQSKFKRIERLIRQQKLLGIGVVVLVVLVFTAALPGVIATHHPHATNANAVGEAPSLQHWLGTDLFGRDVFSRIVYGTRTSLLVAFVSVLSAFAVGSFAGLIAGYIKGPIDHFLGRVMDVLFSLPPELLAIAVAGILGPNLRNTIIAISIVYVPHFFRIARGGAVSQAAQPYVTASRIIGASPLRITSLHIFPNIVSQLVVQLTVSLAYALLLEAALSFLGLGVQPPDPSWGSVLSEGRSYLTSAPWISIFPGLVVIAAVMSVNLVGDGLRDQWDPKER